MHRGGGISRGRGRGRGQGRGRGRGSGQGRGYGCGNFSENGGGRGGHPSGLSGRDIGLWYAKQGKQKREQKEIQNRSVISLHKDHVESINNLLGQNEDVSDSSNHSGCSKGLENDVEVKVENGIEWNVNNVKFDYTETHNCSLTIDPGFDARMFDELLKKQQQDRFLKMLDFRKKLPSFQKQEELLHVISENQVLVVSGETGCGKTTQVAQFILDDCINRKVASTCHIICTQPRRISAIAVAERVASERAESLGTSCGFQIRLESKLPRDRASILYCTTGILLRRLIGDPYLLKVSHIILDEIHERDLMSDFLLIIIRELLPYRPDLKVILMSATLNAEMFSRYFNNCPMIHIPGFTYPVKEYYLEDVLEMTGYRLKTELKKQPPRYTWGNKRDIAKWEEDQEELSKYIDSIKTSYSVGTLNSLEKMDFDQIDYELFVTLIKHICYNLGDGAILIFFPGWDQISKLHDLLHKNSMFNSKNFLIIPLHSLMPTTNQKAVFERPPPGVRKIIIATNIAETSITIDDVVFVIDCGKSKEKSYDAESKVSSLKPVWVSKASSRQRKGRAGRVQDGYCFHFFTKFHLEKFQEYQDPEILRTPLDSLCLQIKILRLGKIWEFLIKAMEPPKQKAVENAIEELTQMRALDSNEELTPLGYHLAKLPVAPKVGRMILFGAIFSCLDPVLTVAASLDFKDPFYVPIHREKEADQRKLILSNDSKSDHLMLINAFWGWEDAKSMNDEGSYCWRNFLSQNDRESKETICSASVWYWFFEELESKR